MAQLKILVAGDPASIHANRFVSLLQEIGYDVRVFQSEHYYAQEEHVRGTTVYVSNFDLTGPWQAPLNGNILIAFSPSEKSYGQARAARARVRLWRSLKRRLLREDVAYLSEDALPPRSAHLKSVIERWKPDLVISLKMQNDGYTVEEALSSLATLRPKWLHFTWGTDIEFFGKHPEYAPIHLPRIRRVLASCDYLLSDCRRDQRQARELGFRGVALGACIAPGGFDLAAIRSVRAEAGDERKMILVKGREGGLVGKALNSMKALARLAPQLKDYRIRVVMATPPVREAAEALKRERGLDCEVLPRLAYRDLLLCFARSRLAIAASDVDGTPSFLIEAMALGALPIHSDMESIREWVEDGVNGLLFPVDDVEALARCIEHGLGDDALVASARERNWTLAQERMDRGKIRQMIKELIEQRVMA